MPTRLALALARATPLLVFLAAAPSAHAQRSTASPPRAATPAAAPARPAAPAAARAAVPLPPPPPGTTPVARPAPSPVTVGALVGIASPRGNGGDASLLLQADASVPWRTTPAGIALAWALPVRTILLSAEGAAGVESGGVALEVTPTLRASLPLRGSRVSLRTDAGVGLAARFTWAETDVTFVGRRTERSTDLTGVARVGFALDWALRPNLAIAFEPLSFGFDLDGNADWLFAAGATFRL
jgi:hypothetical protein